MSADGFITLEFFALSGGSWRSLGTQTITPTVAAAGTETFDRDFTFDCADGIGDVAGNELRVVRIGSGASGDAITGFPGVRWQADASAPTETGLGQRVTAIVSPSNA